MSGGNGAASAAPSLAGPPDLDQARRFLAGLDPDAEAFTFQTFDDSELRRGSLAKVINGSLDDEAHRLDALNARGAGVFVTINRTNLRGRTAADVEAVRGVFADLDGAPLGPVSRCGLTPHLVVESSRRRFHCYWLAQGVPLDQFEALQKAIAARFGGDPAVSDLSRVMRLPGFYHRKGKEPFQSRIIEVNEGLPYTADQLLVEFPPIEDQPARLRTGAQANPDSPFAKINEAALAALDKWVHALFPTARHRPRAKGWRIAAADLGRSLEEDLSITPEGIKDFAIHDQGDRRGGKRTAIDVVIEYGGAAGPAQAGHWLADKLGIEFGAPLYPPAQGRNSATPPPAIASNPSILADFSRAVALRGLVGENATAQLLYLAITSRLLDKPVSIAVKGHSSSGKSHTVDRVLEFFPSEAILKFTGMSERALVYRKDDYKHRTLVIYELTGLRETTEDNLTSYFVRSLLSEGRIEYDVTIRGEGGQYTTQRITKEGPTNLIFTTTKTRVHAENETRVLSLNTDDGTEQTKAVFAALASEVANSVDLSEWRALQSWLQKAESRVTIPFAGSLAAAVPPIAVRLRRDFGAVLALIRAHAILHQQTRARDDAGRIVAALADYAAVRGLVVDVISEGIGAGVSAVVRETVEAVKMLTPVHAGGVAIGDIAKHLDIDKSNASRRVRRAADGGYIRNNEDKRGRAGRWVAGEPLPEAIVLLPEAAALQQAQYATERNAGDGSLPGCCAVAPVQEGIDSPLPETDEPWLSDPAERHNWADDDV